MHACTIKMQILTTRKLANIYVGFHPFSVSLSGELLLLIAQAMNTSLESTFSATAFHFPQHPKEKQHRNLHPQDDNFMMMLLSFLCFESLCIWFHLRIYYCGYHFHLFGFDSSSSNSSMNVELLCYQWRKTTFCRESFDSQRSKSFCFGAGFTRFPWVINSIIFSFMFC